MQKRLMGVINITPDSFSDGNQFNSIEGFKARFDELRQWADIIDIGAESTAPFNEAIAIESELGRFQKYFFPFLEQTDDPEITLSVDTYKPAVFERVCVKIMKHWPKSRVIFNDVSGKIDDELLQVMGKFPDAVYVFSHNLVPTRDKTSDHMKYCDQSSLEDFYQNFVDYFLEGIERLKAADIKFCLDPCFGFSKSREQNHFLLSRFKSFLLQIPYDIEIVIGISRKSFLRFPSDLYIKDLKNLQQVEQIHSNILFHLFSSNFKRNFIIRTHEPYPVISALCSVELFEL